MSSPLPFKAMIIEEVPHDPHPSHEAWVVEDVSATIARRGEDPPTVSGFP